MHHSRENLRFQDQLKGVKRSGFLLSQSHVTENVRRKRFQIEWKLQPDQKRPQRKPDLVIKDGLFPNQVFFYRLNNAPNPIHVDPVLCMQFGYPKPIVHGMLSYTTIVRVVLQHVLDYDEKRIRAIQCRFTGLVFVADQFQIKLWKQPGKIFFEIDVPERDSNVALGIIHFSESAKL